VRQRKQSRQGCLRSQDTLPGDEMDANNISHYRILEKLGAGGMGEVYLAEDTRLGRKVALKVLPASYQYDAERRERFLREARAASALRSPNVAAIYDIGESDNAMFIAMEYVEGELLANKLEAGHLNFHQAIDFATQVAEALDEAHSLGIIHRDIKSSNLIVTPRGVVKVLDFGLAKMVAPPVETDTDRTARLGVETAPGVILGTVAYMSPEQARGLEVDTRSDLFSLGVLLYEMLTGKRPFEGGTTGDLLVSILSREPEPLAHVPVNIPAEMQWVISKALRKDKALRYQTARDFIIDLKNLTQGLNTRVVSPASLTDVGRSQTVPPQPRGSVARDSATRRRARKHIDSIAVLPLVNSSNDPDIDYLSDGITESLINALSRIPKLRVMARSTVFRYKGREVDAQRVGLELNVRAVMTGRMQKVRDRFSIGAELVDVTDGAQLWGEQYTKALSEMFTLQEEISSDIGEKLKLKLSSGDKRRFARQHTRNSEAYELYLKGRYHWSSWTEDGFRQAMACYEQALGKDPNFALAYCGLGETFGVLSYFSPDPAQAQGALLKSKAYAQRALEIDEALSEAHLLLGNIAHLHEWDWRRAEREFRLALELNPNLAAAHQGYSLFLMDEGRTDEAMAEMELALQLDPLSLPVNTSMGFLLFNAGRYSESIAQLRKSLELESKTEMTEGDTTFQLSCQLLGACLEREGEFDQAVNEYLRMFPRRAVSEDINRALRDSYAESGMQGFWRAFAGAASGLAGQRVIAPMFVASIYASLGEADPAFEWIERAFSERAPTLSHIKVDPRFAAVRSDPRFSELLTRMGLGQAAPIS
jgi:serine/threonine protein kinase/tetratricopeptide (TPR) repeat protein